MPEEPVTPPMPAQERMRWGTIVWILVALAVGYEVFVPPFLSAKSAAAIAAKTKEVGKVDMALVMYMQDHDDSYPELSGNLDSKLAPYLNDPQALKDMDGFVWNSKLSGKNRETLSDPNDTWVLYSPNPGLVMFSVGFSDGLARAVSPGYFLHTLQGQDPFHQNTQHGHL